MSRYGAGSRRRAGPETVTIPVQATSAGAVSANQFTGWTHSSGTVFSRTAYGVTTKYFASSVSDTVDIQSKAVSRDQEVVFWASIGRVYLRIANGKALRFETSADTTGGWSVAYVLIGSGGYEDDTNIVSLGSGVPSGINTADTDGDLYTFGVEGFDVYVKWNGVEQWRETQIFSISAGRIGLRCHPSFTTYGFRSVEATFKHSVALYSSPAERLLDVRDFGLSSITTTGSMTAASTTLTVASNPGFAIGDPIIVEIGGESGAGAVGTRGVGGQWPALTYANATAMNADTSQVLNQVCVLLDTAVTYRWNEVSWVLNDTANSYTGFMLPKSLLATITNISGTTFTLDTAATVSTTNANVYMNNAVKYQEVLGATYFSLDDEISDLTVEFPAGNFAWGTHDESLGLGSNRIRWEWRGLGVDETQIFSPEGVMSLELSQGSCTTPVFHDIELLSNCRADGGYQMRYDEGTDRPNQSWPTSLLFGTSSDALIYNVRAIDPNQAGIALSYCTNAIVHDCTIEHTTGHRQYTQWMFNFANCTDCTAYNITIDSDYYLAGYEMFQSTGCVFEDFTCRNAVCSANSADEWRMTRINVTMETGCLDTDYFDWVSEFGVIINISSNIDNQQGNPDGAFNGTFNDFHLVQQADIRSGFAPLTMINMSGTTNYITISGQFPDKPNTLGLIEIPSGAYGGLSKAVRDDSATRFVTVDGVRVIGSNTTGPDIQIDSINGTVTNCVADTIATDGTQSNNIDNAAYNAL